MSYCTNCGAEMKDDARFCASCGHAAELGESTGKVEQTAQLSSDFTQTEKQQDMPQSAPDFQAPIAPPPPAPDFIAAPKVKKVKPDKPKKINNVPQSTNPSIPQGQQIPRPAHIPEVQNHQVPVPHNTPTPAPQNQPPIPQNYAPQGQNRVPPQTPPPVQVKPKKKHRIPWILRFLIANIIIAAVLLLLWFSVGNMITLYIHSEDVVETLNSGSLDLPGAENPYAELPNYIKDMLDNETLTKQNGPITEAVLPYINVEREKIHGFFTSSSVEYTITAPDVELWIKNLDASEAESEETMLASLNAYVKTAPKRTVTVEVEYHRPGFFSIDWQGNYFTTEFADAVCGGFNTGYNSVYEQTMEDLEELFK